LDEVGGFLAALKIRPNLILTCPLPRAAQTADIAAEHLKVRAREEKTALARICDRGPSPADKKYSATGADAGPVMSRIPHQ
jgi:phosphohistidine phosphatase SixA